MIVLKSDQAYLFNLSTDAEDCNKGGGWGLICKMKDANQFRLQNHLIHFIKWQK
jgi:hypothetical protein